MEQKTTSTSEKGFLGTRSNGEIDELLELTTTTAVQLSNFGQVYKGSSLTDKQVPQFVQVLFLSGCVCFDLSTSLAFFMVFRFVPDLLWAFPFGASAIL